MDYQLITQNNANLIDTSELNACCIICLKPLNENIVTLECKHKFHISCCDEHIKKTKKCPCCRTKININTIILWNSCDYFYEINRLKMD